MKGKDVYRTFVRYGKLAPVKQKGFGKDTFHSPPTSYGFYAMPIRFQEMFLVGSLSWSQPKLFPKIDNFKIDNDEYDWDKYNKQAKRAYKEHFHKFKVPTDCELWHHLDVPPNEILQMQGSWVKTSYSAWLKALKKESVKLRAESGGKKGINSTPKRSGYYSKDHFEVFFDYKII